MGIYSWAASCVAFLSRAFRLLAFAAAFDALTAISLRLLAPSFLARASPPSLASSERTLLINDSSMAADFIPCKQGYRTESTILLDTLPAR
jgi:hypothetical protein